MLHWSATVSVMMRPTIHTATMMVGTAVLSMQTQIHVLNVYAIWRLVQLDIIPWLEMDFAMMTLILLNVIMMAEIVVQILTWLEMPYVMMKLTILDVIMMVETVV
jgi:hypothetical protein